MDVRDALGQAKALPSSVLLHRLRADEEAPWIDLGPGGLTVRKLANMLREYDTSPANHRWEDDTQTKGYLRMDFHDAWSRHAPSTSRWGCRFNCSQATSRPGPQRDATAPGT